MIGSFQGTPLPLPSLASRPFQCSEPRSTQSWLKSSSIAAHEATVSYEDIGDIRHDYLWAVQGIVGIECRWGPVAKCMHADLDLLRSQTCNMESGSAKHEGTFRVCGTY